jgi:hypothetical protein
VVFHYDMIGYADSRQISEQVAHRFSKQRPEMNTTENWGLFSPQAETHLQSVMGLQTWDSIRALDFLLGLPDVDATRIGVTGASGGGTQTFILCAIDPRPTVAFPAVMVSTAMQGGCTCENASLLRVDTGNVEIAALFAPKPLGMTAADDWTKDMPTKGFPELKQHYAMLGAPDNVHLKPLLHFGHNYNYVSRAAMYAWFNKQFKLGWPEPIVEEGYERLSRDELSVWDDAHPQPPGGPELERKVLAALHQDAERQLQRASESPESLRALVAPAWDVVIGRTLARAGNSELAVKATRESSHYTASTGLLRNTTYAEELPVIVLRPKTSNHRVLIWASEMGKAGLFGDTAAEGEPEPRDEIRKLLDAGTTVVGADLLYQGEFLPGGEPSAQTRRVENPREAAAFTFGYNRALFAQRVHDLLTLVSYVQQHEPAPVSVELAGLDGTGPIVAAARAQAGAAIDRAAVNTGRFRFGQVLGLQEPNFLPGGAKYGDVPVLLALGAPGKLWLTGEGEAAPRVLQNLYGKAGALEHLRVAPENDHARTAAAAVDWLLSDKEKTRALSGHGSQ